jgi:hypothetical protein
MEGPWPKGITNMAIPDDSSQLTQVINRKEDDMIQEFR